MSRYLTVEDQEGIEISSNTGWSQFIDWVDGLDENEFPDLKRFADEGNSDDAQKLRDQIEEAQNDSAPIPDVKSIVDNLMGILNGEIGSVSVQ